MEDVSIMPFETENLQKCERCLGWYEVRRLWNIRPYNPNGEKETYTTFDGLLKERVKQEPVLLCKNCRLRIWNWITGETRRLDLAPDKMRTKPLELFFYGDNNDNI